MGVTCSDLTVTFPSATNSFWAVVAALIKDEVAFVIDCADSKIKSSNVMSSTETCKIYAKQYISL
jgi:hypothetical protein